MWNMKHRLLAESVPLPDVIQEIICGYLPPLTNKPLMINCHHVSVIDGQKICTVDKNDTMRIRTLGSEQDGAENLSDDSSSPSVSICDYVDQIKLVQAPWNEGKPLILSAMNRGLIQCIDLDQIKDGNIESKFRKFGYDHVQVVRCLGSLEQNGHQLVATGVRDQITVWVFTRRALGQIQGQYQQTKILTFKIDSGPGFATGRADDRWVPVQSLAWIPGSGSGSGSRSGSKCRLVTGSVNGWIKVWDLDLDLDQGLGHSQCVYYVNIGSKVNSLVHMIDGESSVLISGSQDGMLRIYDTKTMECLAVSQGHTGGVNSLCVLKNQYVCSGSEDGTLRIWDIRAKKCIETMGHNGATDQTERHGIRYVESLPDGRLISLSDKDLLEIWSM
jgi:WD40 repeat protein